MITNLEVENWKSFEHAKLDIDPLTVIIGTNSSGKSNILDGLSFLHRIAGGSMLTAALQGDGAIPPLRGGVEWAARKPGIKFALSVQLYEDESTDYLYRIESVSDRSRCELESESLHRIKYRLGKKEDRKGQSGRISLFHTESASADSPTIVARLYNERRGTTRQVGRASAALFQLNGQKLRSEIQEGVELVTEALQNIFILDPIPSHMRTFSPLSDKLDADAGNIAGVLAAIPVGQKQQVQEKLNHYARALPEGDISKVWAETVGKFNTDAMLYCRETLGKKGTAHEVDARGMSDGSLRFLAILTALLTRPEKSLLVIEEVDNGLHPSRSHLLLSMLAEIGRERSIDVVVTTHNPALLDAMGTRLVPFITVAHRDRTTGASKLTLLEDIAKLPKLLAQGPVGRLSSQGLIERALQHQSE